VGVALTAAAGRPREMPLRTPLAEAVPASIGTGRGRDLVVPPAELRAAGVDDHLFRAYVASGAAPFSVYVGYYRTQSRGRTIHSPRNCLPGGGWEALANRRQQIATPAGPVTVNRYLLHRRGESAVVLYWYQGRGRVEADEYRVKWNLLRDAALRRRSEESLVRVMVPVRGSEAEAFRVAADAAARLVPAMKTALPT
jgi:EpsI family protein